MREFWKHIVHFVLCHLGRHEPKRFEDGSSGHNYDHETRTCTCVYKHCFVVFTHRLN